MSKHSVLVSVVALLTAAGGVVQAAPDTYVSTDGRDVWPCSHARPCRTFARALTVTDPGGTVLALDSGLYDETSVVIRQSVSMVAAPGVVAELTAPGGSTGIVFVNAGPDDVVVLRGLTLVGQAGTPLNGIVYNLAHALHVESCVVTGVPTKGILALYTGQLFVSASVFRDNVIGISVEGAPASIDDVRLENNGIGLLSTLGAVVTVRGSTASGSGLTGFLASALGGGDPELATAELTLEDCMATGGGTGIKAEGFSGGSALVRISRCVVSGNDTGIEAAEGGSVETRQNSTVAGNVTDVVGTLTAIPGI